MSDARTELPVIRQAMSREREAAQVITYKGLSLEIVFMPDDMNERPKSDEFFTFSAQDLADFESGKWWLCNVLVNLVDEDGEWIDTDHAEAYGCVPSNRDHSALIFGLCDRVISNYHTQQSTAQGE